MEQGIEAQYSMSGEPQQNRVAERRNHNLDGYGAKHDQLLHVASKFMDGGFENCHSYSQQSPQ
jgi:hypothetical protein